MSLLISLYENRPICFAMSARIHGSLDRFLDRVEMGCIVIQNNNNCPISSRRLRRIPPTAPSGDFEAPPLVVKKKNVALLPLPVDLQVHLPHRATPPRTCIRLYLRASLAVIAAPLLLLASAQLGAVRLDAPGAHIATSLRASTMCFSPWRSPCAAPPPRHHRSGAPSYHRPLPAHRRGSRGG
jgi:hypothetical protein